MRKQKWITQITIAALLSMASLAGLHAQQAPPPPPPPPPQNGWAVTGGGPIFIAGMAEGGAGKVVTGAPYSAEAITETVQTLAEGNQIRHKTTTDLYRDSQGRTRREETLGDMGPWATTGSNGQKVIFINDPVAGVSYVLNPSPQIAFKMAPGKTDVRFTATRVRIEKGTTPAGGGEGGVSLSVPGAPPLEGGDVMFLRTQKFVGNGKDQAGTTESLGTQMMEGVEATGTRTTVTIPAGQIGNEQPIKIVTERWYSPLLQAVVMSKQSDPRVGVTTYRLTNINLDEPSPDLFQVPAGYTVEEGPAQIIIKAPQPPAGQ